MACVYPVGSDGVLGEDMPVLISHPHRPRQREAEDLADGAVELFGVGPEGVGGVLDGAAAGVEDVEEFVAVEAGEFLFLGGLLLIAGIAAVGGEQGFNGGDFFRGLEAGQAVGLGAGDEGVAALEEDGAAGIETGANEVAVGGEVGGRIAVFIEHLVFLFGGALDFLEGGDEGRDGFTGEFGSSLGILAGLAGLAGTGAGLLHGGIETVQIEGGDVLLVEGGGIVAAGGEDGLGEDKVFELALLIVAALLRGGGGWNGGRDDGVRHLRICVI